MTQLTLRLTKGSGLTNAELDENFVYLDGRANTLQSEIDNIVDVVIPALESGTAEFLSGKQPLNSKLTSLSNVAVNGVMSIVDGVITPRVISPASTNIVISRGDGAGGNPTIDTGINVLTNSSSHTITNKNIDGNNNTITNVSLTQSVKGILPIASGGTNATTAAGVRSSIGALPTTSGTGVVVKTGVDQTVVRQIEVSGTGLSVSNGPGVAGNPVISSNATSLNTGSTIVARDSSGNFSAGIVTATLNGTATTSLSVLNGVYTIGDQTIAGTKTFSSPIIANLTGNVVGNVTGNVTGNITGNAGTVTNGVYTSGSYANPVWLTSLAGSKVTSIPNSSLQNSSFTINGVTVSLGGSTNIPSDYLPNTSTNTPNTIVARDSSGNFSAGRMTGNLTGNVTGNVAGNTVGTHTGPVIGNVTGNVTGTVIGLATANVPNTGGQMSGFLSLVANPVNPLHAATKQYVDTTAYTIISGTNYTYNFTNIVGQWNDNYNFFDVYPPAGKTMVNLVAFMPSIAFMHYSGTVNGDDSTRCYWVPYNGDRVRVYVQNTEQRSWPAANWLAVWR